MAHPNALLVERLFAALNRHDAGAMAECYGADATFHDIAFDLRGNRRIHNMWRMICEGESEIAVTVESIEANDRTGTARIVDSYQFGRSSRKPGRPVVNPITSQFVFKDGRIAEQVDHCDPRKWADMAIGGPRGWLAGRIGLLRSITANLKVFWFIARHPESATKRRPHVDS